MMQLIDGKKLAEKIKTAVAKEVFAENGGHPNLAIILANDREDSKLYVSLKEQEAKKVGIDTHLYKIEIFDTEKSLLDLIDFLNKDKIVDGILVQLPLPERYDTAKIINAVSSEKDVDGFNEHKPDYIMSPVFAAILKCLADINFDFSGKTISILYNSEIFGESLEKILLPLGAQVKKISVKDFELLQGEASQKKFEEINKISQVGDVLISALGLPEFVKAEMIKKDAVLIDVGITKVNGHVLGDVDAKSVKDKASFLTPVPGGVGPLTIALLFKNVLEIYKRRKQ